METTPNEAKRTEALEAQLNVLTRKMKDTEDLFRVEMLGQLLFESGSAHIKKEGRRMLARIAESLKNRKDKMVLVEGHTDTIEIKGEMVQIYPTNWELSAARAISVVHILQARGVPLKMLSAVARGPFQPVAGNKTPVGRAKNRRVVIMLALAIDSSPTM